MKFNRENLRRFTPAQIIVFYYFLAIAFSFLLLNLPGVYLPGVKISFIDSLFTAVSAVSVTGLTPISIGEYLFGFRYLHAYACFANWWNWNYVDRYIFLASC